MAFTHNFLSIPIEPSQVSILNPSHFISPNSSNFSSNLRFKAPNHSIFPNIHKIAHKTTKVKSQEPEVTVASDAFTQFKHLLLPITDRNPYLSDGTKQAISTVTALAKKYGADITVVVIDEQLKESLPEHETQLSSIRWHISEGGFKDYSLLERLGEGSKPTAIIGEVADDLNLDLVIISMEAIHTKHIDANLLAEFIPCPVMLLPL
ncbi:PREDICTED: uncharacterized protein LOC109332186 isoform X2 [Lupinus angustifolius]|uniref:uncharacterized protein LOC109332186 isoform X2 n=1 Tax=Lupinus angustifolius TaxID=3871 RepID=UPI00092E317E|nr:PREDICTED: uncharacterized protein LOC109332186 isoform X2 [Lupinus angustifolius]